MSSDTITGLWNYADLQPNIQIGVGCFLERKDSFERFRSTQNPGLVLGDGVQVYTWTTFNVEPTGQIEVGENSILVGAVFMCAGKVTIGKRVIVSYNVTIADSDFHPKEPELRKLDAIANSPSGDKNLRPLLVTRPVIVEDDVWIGIGAIILKGVRIGRGAKIGAGSVVTSNIPAGAEVKGNPARIVAEGIDL